MPESLAISWFELDATPAARREYEAWLSPYERARAARFLDPAQGRRFVVAHGRLREILGRRLGRAPAALEFAYGPVGKPRLAGGGAHFNLSHSGGYALVGVYAEELGVDIEAERPRLDGLGLARRFFTAREAAWLEGLAPEDRARGFGRLWTCKEAWMKADGRGLAQNLRRIEVSFAAGAAALSALDAPERPWFVRELDLTPGYRAAVVTVAPPQRVEVSFLPPA